MSRLEPHGQVGAIGCPFETGFALLRNAASGVSFFECVPHDPLKPSDPKGASGYWPVIPPLKKGVRGIFILLSAASPHAD